VKLPHQFFVTIANSSLHMSIMKAMTRNTN